MKREIKEFNFKQFGARNAPWDQVLKFVFTFGRKGKLFEVVDISHFPPEHFNCRCSWRHEDDT